MTALLRHEDVATDDYGRGGTSNHGTKLHLTRRKVTAAVLTEMFPAVNPGLKALGTRILVQLKRTPKTTKGGIIVPDTAVDDDRKAVAWAKVIAIGKKAEAECEGEIKVDMYVRVPKWGGDRVTIDEIDFVNFNWWDAINEVTDVGILPF